MQGAWGEAACDVGGWRGLSDLADEGLALALAG